MVDKLFAVALLGSSAPTFVVDRFGQSILSQARHIKLLFDCEGGNLRTADRRCKIQTIIQRLTSEFYRGILGYNTNCIVL